MTASGCGAGKTRPTQSCRTEDDGCARPKTIMSFAVVLVVGPHEFAASGSPRRIRMPYSVCPLGDVIGKVHKW